MFLKIIQWLSIQKVIFTLVLGELHWRGLWNTTCSLFCPMKYPHKSNMHYDNDITVHSVYLQTVFYGLCLIIKYILSYLIVPNISTDLLCVTTLDKLRTIGTYLSRTSENCSLFIKENHPICLHGDVQSLILTVQDYILY